MEICIIFLLCWWWGRMVLNHSWSKFCSMVVRKSTKLWCIYAISKCYVLVLELYQLERKVAFKKTNWDLWWYLIGKGMILDHQIEFWDYLEDSKLIYKYWWLLSFKLVFLSIKGDNLILEQLLIMRVNVSCVEIIWAGSSSWPWLTRTGPKLLIGRVEPIRGVHT